MLGGANVKYCDQERKMYILLTKVSPSSFSPTHYPLLNPSTTRQTETSGCALQSCKGNQSHASRNPCFLWCILNTLQRRAGPLHFVICSSCDASSMYCIWQGGLSRCIHVIHNAALSSLGDALDCILSKCHIKLKVANPATSNGLVSL